MINLKIQKVHPDAIVPSYATSGAACFDLHAIWPSTAMREPLFPGETVTIRTGLAFEIPKGYVMLIFSRSGHGFKNDVRLANCVGVIDSDYRGEVLVKLRSDDELLPATPYGITPDTSVLNIGPGDRVAQAMLVPVPRVVFEVAQKLGETERGSGGFGSTGV